MRRVVVCWDGSDGAKRALKAAQRMVDENVGELVVLHVAEVFEPRGPDGQPLKPDAQGTGMPVLLLFPTLHSFPHSFFLLGGVLDFLSMVNPMEQEMRHMNDITEREKAAKAHEEFENLAEDAPKVSTPCRMLFTPTCSSSSIALLYRNASRT
jgi:hypothetical protein